MRLRARALACAGHLLQADPATLTIAGGRIERSSGEATALGLADVARALQPYGQLYGSSPPLDESFIFDTGNRLTFALSVHVAKVALDPRTGEYEIVDYLVVHDTGVMLDETIVAGQLIGAVADGVGGAMLSELLYDDQAQLVTGSLADYLVVTAAEAPRVRLAHAATTPTTNPLGVRGVGEGGIIAVAPAIINALSRAISPTDSGFEQDLFHLPLKPQALLAVLDRCASG
jgi:aerobic carbon-monoxide dehydrogenase large subunit